MRVAGVDIGTNTIRLLVADIVDGSIIDIARRTEVVGLGRGVEESGVLSDDALAAARSALEDYAGVLRVAGPDRVRAVATSASRDAANADELVAIVTSTLGVAPEIIGGDEEAALSFAGARWATSRPAPYLVIDPGGGSTEFVFGVSEPEYTVSVGAGSVRLTDRFLATKPVSDQAVRAAREQVRSLFGALDLPDTPRTVIGVAGTFRALASVHLALGYYDRNLTHGVVMNQEDLDGLVARLAPLTLDETEAITSLPPGRAPVILGGSIVAAEAIRASGSDEVVISKTGLLQGMVLSMASSL